ncbi:MAG: T9SS type A sorting domain-containing protein [Saprospiraceae bacterium]
MRNLFLYLYLLFLLIVPSRVLAQKEDNIWFLGGSSASDSVYKTCMFDFSGDILNRTYLYQNLPFSFTNTSISDAEGNLLCFSNGENIYSRNRQAMENGLDFFPKSNGSQYPALQSFLLLPLPSDAQKVVYIYGDPDFVNDFTFTGYISLKYAIADLGLNGGLGSVVQRELIAGTDTTAVGQITAIRHGNGRDWWVLVPRFEPNVYYRFLLTPNGLNSAGTQINPSAPVGLGQVVFSPDGSWYARFNWHGVTGNGNSTFDLYRFDRCSGLLGEHITKTYNTGSPSGRPGGIAFSNSSRYLYVSRWDSLFQYNLQAPDILASEAVVAVYDGFLADFNQPTRFFTLLLAPDKKIYCSVPNTNSRYLHVIESPDLPGAACNVQQHAIHLPVFNNNLLPNMPYYRLYDQNGSPCDTLGINGPPTSTRPLANSPHLRLYPNPAASGWVVLDSEQAPSQPRRLRFHDAQGRLVLEQPHPEVGRSHRFSLAALQPGYYLLEIECADGRRYVEKVVVGK